MAILTVFTPTYNRAYILPQCYEAMKRQTEQDFVWLVVDDGSSDGTEELVKGWMQEEHGFTLRYVRQENKGMHGAHNLAYENIIGGFIDILFFDAKSGSSIALRVYVNAKNLKIP